MSDGAKSDDCCGKNLTRGEFLAAGASMAAGASVGGVELARDVAAEGGAQMASPCQPPCDPQGNPSWAIRAGILNALWGDIVPRLAAKRWLDETNAAGSSPILPGIGVPTLTSEIAALSGSTEFNSRRDDVINYLSAAPAPGMMPINVLGFGQFDFVLSDQGLDLFLPPDLPHDGVSNLKDVKEVFRYYMFRRTGRSSLGFPGYMDGRVSSISLDAPTGPSQIQMDYNVVAQLVESSSVRPQCRDDVLTCLRLHRRPRDPDRERPLPDDVIELTADSFSCIVSPTRCWQLSGAVYRGILTELPRIVATIWFERASAAVLSSSPPPSSPCGSPWDGNPDPGLVPPDDSSYLNRFMRPGTPGDRGLRGIFEERLETSLPDPSRMRFDTYIPADSAGDVRITDRGIRIPEPLNLPGTDKSALVNIYTEIMNGKAGNPVFTDSKTSI